jgi:hypothetical protein
VIGFQIAKLSAVQGVLMNITEVAMVAAITLGTVATAAVSMDVPALSRQAESTVARANCRSVDTAIIAYVSEWEVLPAALKDVKPYVQGDVTAYRIVAGKAVGPGCNAYYQR